jgi:exopolyphosphatase/guanosine-5'-triphosphate,3'-diphosphate pyrophosphatase
LDDAAAERALRCLERFGQRLRAMHADSVRVVGTNALRRAKRKRWFLERARAALGSSHRNHLGPGRGAAHLFGRGAHQSHEPGQALVIDIGGGSTEVVIGEGSIRCCWRVCRWAAWA